MKATILILLLFQVLFGVAQGELKKNSTPTKPSTTDCPTWNNKSKKSSKAAYFQYLRSPKTKVNPQATNNPYNYRDSKIQPNSVPQKNEISNQKRNIKLPPEETNSEKAEIVEPKETEKSSIAFSKKNNTANSTAEENIINTKSEKSSSIEDKNPILSKVSSEGKTENKNAQGDAKGDDKKTEIKDNNKKENSKIKRKLDRMSRKKTKVGRHSNAKCPSF